MNEEFSQEFIPKSNWFKFETVGDWIKGTFVGKKEKAGDGVMPDQIVYELTSVTTNEGTREGNYFVGVRADKDYINLRMNTAKIGQRVGFKFEKLVESSKKGMQPAKSICPYVWDMDPNYNPEPFDGTELPKFE